MSGTSSKVEKTIGEQVAELLQRKPQNYDVIFSVGPQKEKVEAVKILLKAASPVFERKFDQNWDQALAREGEVGIPLPHFEPTVFKLFVYLIISDKWSFKALKKLNLPPNTVLSLLGLCRHYKITKAIENLEKAAHDFIHFQVNQKISLRGVGFLGPIDRDTHFHVTVQVKKWVRGSYTYDSGTLKKNIFTRKGNNFYFLFDAPIKIEPNAYDSSWGNGYDIYYTLKGTNNVSQFKVVNPKDEYVQISGIEFHLNSYSWNSTPLAELLFKQK